MNEKDKILEETLTAFEKHNYNGIALLPTGTGKGKIMIEAAKRINPESILYLCNTTLLRDKMFKDELHKWDASYLLNRMDLQCYQTACKWKNKNYQLLLADEFDAALTPTYSKAITQNNFQYKLLVSASLDDKKKKQAEKIAPIVYERKINDLIENKVLNKVNYYFIHYDLTAEENYQYLQYNKEFQVLLNSVKTADVNRKLEMLQIKRKHFMSSLKSSAEVTKWVVKNIDKNNEKILIFCGLSEQADKVSENSYHSNNDNTEALEKFDAGVINKIAVCNKVDRGLNLNGVKHIVHESISKSKTRLTQRNGRGMRLEVNDTLNVYFLIPYFKHPFHGKKATIVQQWVMDSTVDMDLSKAKVIKYDSR